MEREIGFVLRYPFVVFFNSQIYFYVEEEEGSDSEQFRLMIIYLGILAYVIFYLFIGLVILHSVGFLASLSFVFYRL